MRAWGTGLLVAALLACVGDENGADDGSDRDAVQVEVEPGTDAAADAGTDPGPDCGGTVGTAGQWQPCETTCDCAPGPGVMCYGEAYTAPHKMCLVDKPVAGACPPDPNHPGQPSKYLNFNYGVLETYGLRYKALCFPTCADDEDCTNLNPALTYCPPISQTYWDGATVAGVPTCQVRNMSPE